MSAGSPFVIRALCNALKINPEDLITDRDQTEENTHTSETMSGDLPEEIAYDRKLKYINFSVLSVLFFPFLNLLIPSVLYLAFRRALSNVPSKAAALKILSLQIFWSFITLVVMILIPVLDQYLTHIGELFEIPLFVWGYLILVIVLIAITLSTASRINRAKQLLPFVPNIL
jgi:hypothetical protein